MINILQTIVEYFITFILLVMSPFIAPLKSLIISPDIIVTAVESAQFLSGAFNTFDFIFPVELMFNLMAIVLSLEGIILFFKLAISGYHLVNPFK